MTEVDFEIRLQELVFQANQEEIPLDYVYSILNRQTIIAETILRLNIEKAYKERFK
jgi:hypothetical protein